MNSSDAGMTEWAAFLAVMATAGALASASGADWATWRGPNASGISSESGWNPQALNGAPKPLWQANVGAGHSCLTVAGQDLYTMGNKDGKDIVYCLNAKTGKEIWQHSHPCPSGSYAGPRATPVLDGDLLYTVSRNGDVYCLDAKKGEVKWNKNLVAEFGAQNITWGMSGSPMIDGPAVYLNACAHGIALDKLTGAKIWSSPAGKCGYATPVIFKTGDKKIIAIAGAKAITGVDAATGTSLWSHPWETAYDVNAADPLFFDGKLFVSSGYDHGCTLLDLSAGTPKVLWENKNMRNHFSSSILLGGFIYGVDGNTGSGALACIDAKTGERKWSQGKGYENMMAADGKLIVIDGSGAVTIAEATPSSYKETATGKVLSGNGQEWTAPVLANGLLYCRNGNGDLVCVDVSK